MFTFVQRASGTELPCEARVGRRLRIDHSHGIVISGDAWLGDDVILRNGVTIGLKHTGVRGSPVIGDRADIGAGAKILGPIHIGNDVSIGANRGGPLRCARQFDCGGRAGPDLFEKNARPRRILDQGVQVLMTPALSIVVIGRNEGNRLVACLESIRNSRSLPTQIELIYVDSNSSDGSPERAAGLGATVLRLGPGKQSAARARNLGWRSANAPFIFPGRRHDSRTRVSGSRDERV